MIREQILPPAITVDPSFDVVLRRGHGHRRYVMQRCASAPFRWESLEYVNGVLVRPWPYMTKSDAMIAREQIEDEIVFQIKVGGYVLTSGGAHPLPPHTEAALQVVRQELIQANTNDDLSSPDERCLRLVSISDKSRNGGMR